MGGTKEGDWEDLTLVVWIEEIGTCFTVSCFFLAYLLHEGTLIFVSYKIFGCT